MEVRWLTEVQAWEPAQLHHDGLDMRLRPRTNPIEVGRPMRYVEPFALTSLRSMLITRIRPSIWVCTHRSLAPLLSDENPVSIIDTRHGSDLERVDDGPSERKEL